jgi:gamma-glutamyltranspeptidase/glutathione hydrolase
LTWAQGEAVVSASHPLAAQAGAEILRKGGNAVDAAAAIQFALNVVEPQSSGIGGGAFIVVHDRASGDTHMLDARESAPAAATPDQFAGHDFQNNSVNGIAVGVPGTLAGFAEAQAKWGKLTLSDVLQPAIRLARDGFAVTPYLAHSLESGRVALQPEARALYHDGTGKPLALGSWLRQPELAHTFQLIARQGPEVFYRGEIAQAIVQAQKRSSLGAAGVGRMTMEDLANYRIIERQPLVGRYRGYTVVTMPPPSSGGVALLQTLGMLERFPLGRQQGYGAGEPKAVHVVVESLRQAMADRALWLGDPDATSIPLQALLDPDALRRRSEAIDPENRAAIPQVMTAPEGTNTTHFSVVDGNGLVVSCTSTIEQAWGSGILVVGYGFLLNNELTDFNRVPRQGSDDPGANDVRPGMRPRSSMAPTLVFRDGDWRWAYGSPGGATIISTVLEVTLDLIDYGLPAEVAVRQPRFAVLGGEGHTLVEPSFPDSVADVLRRMGHDLSSADSPIGSVQVVGESPVNHRRWGAADPRREGTVIIP